MTFTRSRSWCLGLASAALLCAPSSAQSILFADGFENGLTHWTATGLWHREHATDPCGSLAAPFPEGASAAYYGIAGQCDYDTGFSGNLGFLAMSTSIPLPAGGPAASLQCWTWREAEACVLPFNYDYFRIFVSSDGGASFSPVAQSCSPPFEGPERVWSLRHVDLTPYLGQSVAIAFGFQTVDGNLNDYVGAFVDRVEIRLEAGVPFCATTCPCTGPANVPAIAYGGASGCTNSFALEGELSAAGSPSVAADDVVLTARELPASTIALFVQSLGSNGGVPFGDGTLCLGSGLLRLAARPATQGVSSYPGPGDAQVAIVGQLPAAGGTRHYQVVYRDAATYCTSSQFNATNGFTIAWGP